MFASICVKALSVKHERRYGLLHAAFQPAYAVHSASNSMRSPCLLRQIISCAKASIQAGLVSSLAKGGPDTLC